MKETLMFACTLVVCAASYAGSIYKCKQSDGSVTFSNVACPGGAASRERIGIHQEDSGLEEQAQRSYSIQDQLSRMQGNSISPAKAAGNTTNYFGGVSTTSQRLFLTQDSARTRALEDAGYKDYSRLTASQRARVDEAMRKYQYSQSTREEGQDSGAQQLLKQQAQQQERRRQVEDTYRHERKMSNLGVQGHEGRLKNAAKDCKATIGASCR